MLLGLGSEGAPPGWAAAQGVQFGSLREEELPRQPGRAAGCTVPSSSLLQAAGGGQEPASRSPPDCLEPTSRPPKTARERPRDAPSCSEVSSGSCPPPSGSPLKGSASPSWPFVRGGGTGSTPSRLFFAPRRLPVPPQLFPSTPAPWRGPEGAPLCQAGPGQPWAGIQPICFSSIPPPPRSPFASRSPLRKQLGLPVSSAGGRTKRGWQAVKWLPVGQPCRPPALPSPAAAAAAAAGAPAPTLAKLLGGSASPQPAASLGREPPGSRDLLCGGDVLQFPFIFFEGVIIVSFWPLFTPPPPHTHTVPSAPSLPCLSRQQKSNPSRSWCCFGG
ncbi:uncharacterized protein LOC135188213 [Pogoniulus pusillus]|uniref:uncharacterized protein LOC135188213 n=1 Tax=Pogoniulus pusillus TaxID=488313 RepID=UPI0030B98DAD